jgi:hypothetical protein
MLQYRYVAYVPIDYRERVGKTKVRLFRDSLRMLQYIVSAILFYNPIKLFIVLCLVLIAIGLAAIVLALLGRSLFLAGVGVASMLCAVLVFAVGLLADALRQYTMHRVTPPKP